MNKRWFRIAVAGLLVLLLNFGLAGSALAQGSDNAKAAARKIVVFQDWVVNPAAQDRIIELSGATKIKSLPLINAVVVMSSAASNRALQNKAEIVRVDPDSLVYTLAKPTPTPPAEILPWGVNQIDAEKVWATNTGAGVNVAVLDTGIDLDHSDLKDNIVGGFNTINPLKSADDDNGHGTHVAGIIAGVDNTIGVIGVAPKASLYAVKVLSRTGSGYTSDIIEGLQWCVDNGIQVINMSFGTSVYNQSFHGAISAASTAGIVLVAAAGNSGPGDNTVMYPAKFTEVIAVSATDSSDGIASFSSRGPEIDVAAPGVGILSTYKGNGYKTFSGTSMASPHVAGVAALVIASNTSLTPLTPGQVQSILQDTADDDLMAPGFDNDLGWGRVNAQKAAIYVPSLP